MEICGYMPLPLVFWQPHKFGGFDYFRYESD